MKTAAVICEYNPLHDGHRFMLARMREYAGEDGAILCLMSGDYVQRGEPAVFGKYERAREAVLAGADLVLELPYPWSSSVAERFAMGGISILSKLGIVDRLFFGSEEKSAAALERISDNFASKAFEEKYRELRKTEKTLSFPMLREKCYTECFGNAPALQKNEILGMHYIGETKKRGCPFSFESTPIAVDICAEGIRKKLREQQRTDCAFLENGEKAILGDLLLSGKNDRFSRSVGDCSSLAGLFSLVRSKNDTDARLKRELLSVLFESEGREREEPAFTVLLAANEKGRKLLAAVKKKGGITTVTKQGRPPKEENAAKQFTLYKKAERFYTLFTREQSAPNDCMKKAPFMKNEKEYEKNTCISEESIV